jgi:alpha-beta hydrolase superfamily lysophospholipase
MIRKLLKQFAYLAGYGLVGALAVIVVVYSLRLSSLPDLAVWHTAKLTSEFRARDAATVRTLDDYRALEVRLFAELQENIYDRVAPQDRRRYGRYSRGSVADPLAQTVNWNRTFELATQDPRGGVLLIHGLSDSPYSIRALAERLNAKGFHVLGLRLPGHGTAPSALTDVRWEDWAAAVRLAARHLSREIGAGKPLHMVGYSTGAALAVEYAVAREEGEDLPRVDRTVLLSAAIGVSPAAGLAVWQERIGRVIGLQQLAWTDIVPEYDPYKYNSFPVNAADQIYRLTQRIGKGLTSASRPSTTFPGILAFQSAADATVSTPAVIAAFFRSLIPGKHELVLFDINRRADVTDLYRPGTPEVREQLLRGPALPFELRIVGNAGSDTSKISIVHRKSSGETTEASTDLTWPAGVFSLSHVALPFAPDDPVYGADHPVNHKQIYLGATELRGENGVLAIAPTNLVRQRYNPFFDYMAGRIEQFLLDAKASQK